MALITGTILLMMMLLIVILFFIPVIIEIDSASDYYVIRYGGIAEVRLLVVGEGIKMQLYVAGWRWILDPFEKGDTKPADNDRAPVKRKRQKKEVNIKQMAAKVVNVMRSFDIEHWHLDIDTGDYVTNAYLYPAFVALRSVGGYWNVNFSGVTVIKVRVKNTPARAAFAYLSY